MSCRSSLVCLLSLAFLGLFPAPSAAQTATATLAGVVVDESDAVVAGVVVNLVNTDTSFERVVTTGPEGAFAFPFVVPGRYRVSAQRDGLRLQTCATLRSVSVMPSVCVSYCGWAHSVTLSP
jgi:hypothetical protein